MSRWLPTNAQLEVLEASFGSCRYPDASVRTALAAHLGIEPRQVQVWFQNRRQKDKKFGSSASGEKDKKPESPGERGDKPASPVIDDITADRDVSSPPTPPSSFVSNPMPLPAVPAGSFLQGAPAVSSLQQAFRILYPGGNDLASVLNAPGMRPPLSMGPPPGVGVMNSTQQQQQLQYDAVFNQLAMARAAARSAISKPQKLPRLNGIPMTRRQQSMDAIEILSRGLGR